MSAVIYVFPLVRVERCADAPARIQDISPTVAFVVNVRADTAELIHEMAQDWGCTPSQFLAETIEDSLINPFGKK